MYFWSNLKEDIFKFFRLSYNWLFPLLAFILLQVMFYVPSVKKYLDLSKVDHNSILTINLTLAGFLLTSIGIMISVSDKPFIKVLIETGHWNEIHKCALLGILFHISSSLLALFTLITKFNSLTIFNIEITTFIIGLVYLTSTVFWLRTSFKYIK